MAFHFTDEQLDVEVLQQLKQHYGQTHAIGRWELVEKIFGSIPLIDRTNDNVCDRQVREAVERLRKSGVLICDMGDGSGRFLATTVQEYQAFRNRYGGRAFAIIETLREMDKAAAKQWSNPMQPNLL
jgi:hypothetical protein